MATQLLFADSVNTTQRGNFKSARKFWDLKQIVDWMYKLTGFLFFWQAIFWFVAQQVFTTCKTSVHHKDPFLTQQIFKVSNIGMYWTESTLPV